MSVYMYYDLEHFHSYLPGLLWFTCSGQYTVDLYWSWLYWIACYIP
jgi:hypothetical protein